MKSILCILFIPFFCLSQNIDDLFSKRGEIYFSFKYNNRGQLNDISKIVSLDHKTDETYAFAYANKKEYLNFLERDINHKIIPFKPLNFTNGNKNNWDYYPSYQEYVQMMNSFSTTYPDICKLHSLGTLNSGREILIVQISNNVGVKENEPSFLYTSSMHGNELSGYILSLRLIDYLLNGYGNNPKVSNLVDGVDIWINPLANPDGAYAGGNQNVWSATRYNANWIDLNRNYPDPQDGPHPDGNPYQNETNIFLGLADTINFTIAANMHSGAEVVNYPWDTWSNITADDNWWRYVSRQYADSCQAYSSNEYFNYLDNGITNGNNWYEVDGGRQDYMNHFRQCREFTLELSNEKIPNPNDLQNLWDANYPSLLNYINHSLLGIRGIVTDSTTGIPINAKIEILGHDIDSSHVFSNLPIGNYHRYLYQGNYDLTFSKPGYISKTINKTILNNEITLQDVKLSPINSAPTSIIDLPKNIRKNLVIDILGRKNNRKDNLQISKQSDEKIQKNIIIK